jgi:hypothetical protein
MPSPTIANIRRTALAIRWGLLQNGSWAHFEKKNPSLRILLFKAQASLFHMVGLSRGEIQKSDFTP